MLSRYGVFAVMLIPFLALSACDNVTEGNDSLTQQEVDALLKVIASGFHALDTHAALADAERFLFIRSTPPEEESDGEKFEMAIDSSYACSGGGSATIVGKATFDPDEESAMTYSLARYSSDCVASTDGVTFHLDIYYGMREEGDIRFDSAWEGDDLNVAFERNGATTGTVTWETSGRSGACEIDLAIAEQLTSNAWAQDSSWKQLRKISGDLCGISVNSVLEGDFQD